MGFESPEPVQRYALKPLVVGGCDGKVVSLTGSGKTLVFSIPLVNKLLHSGVTGTLTQAFESRKMYRIIINDYFSQGFNIRTFICIVRANE